MQNICSRSTKVYIFTLLLLAGCSFQFPAFIRNISSQPIIVHLGGLDDRELQIPYLHYAPHLYKPSYKIVRQLTDTLVTQQQDKKLVFTLPAHSTCLLNVSGFTMYNAQLSLKMQRIDGSILQLSNSDLIQKAHYKSWRGHRIWLDLQ